jgi:hypothetical protein
MIDIPQIDKQIVDIINPDFESGPWICGGACMSWIQGEELPTYRDIDVYFKNATQWQLFVTQMKKIYPDTNGRFSYTHVVETDNSLTFWLQADGHQWTIQAIKLYYSETIEEIFSKFDITACKIATDGKTFKVGSPETVNHIFNKIIDIPELKLNSVARVIKYLSKGYTLTEETYDKLSASTTTVWDFKYDTSIEYSEQ